MKIRPEHLHQFTDEGGRPQRKRQEKRKGRIYVDEDDFPTKKKDSHIGINKRERNRR